MAIIAGAWEPQKRGMTTQDWWDAGIWITVVLAAVAVGYLIALTW